MKVILSILILSVIVMTVPVRGDEVFDHPDSFGGPGDGYHSAFVVFFRQRGNKRYRYECNISNVAFEELLKQLNRKERLKYTCSPFLASVEEYHPDGVPSK